ncbi:MAG: SLBB domain-containing protein [Vulcanimicrobiaceae bacterium]
MSVKFTLSYRRDSLLLAAAFVAATAAPALALVHAGDQLQVTVYNHPELSKAVTVDARDRLSLPLAGTIDATGLDPQHVAQRIARALDSYLVKPAVDVQVVGQTSSIFISGGRGGVLKYEPGESLAAALDDIYKTNDASSKDGSTTSEMLRVDLHRVALQRDNATVGTYDMSQSSRQATSGPELEPGDTIVLVNKPDVVRVAGEVTHPGLAYLAPDETLSAALTQAGGALPTAATTNIVLQRDGASQVLAMGDPQFNQPLKDGDEITVPVAPRVSIAGLVATPGTISLKTDFSLLSAIYNAGGPTKWADLADVQIVRNGTKSTYDITRLTHGDLTQNPTLKDGDLVFVPEGHKVDFGSIFGSLATFLVNPLHL